MSEVSHLMEKNNMILYLLVTGGYATITAQMGPRQKNIKIYRVTVKDPNNIEGLYSR